MIDGLYRTSLFALYQLTLVTGIALMPLALAGRRLGVTLPVGRVVDAIARRYDDAAEATI
jgi:hypothetical protein